MNENKKAATSWIILGCACLGILIGFMSGMSVSPIVSAVVGLIFAFTGGSIIVLIKGRGDEELSLMGQCISALTLMVLAGVVIGVAARANDWLYFKDSKSPQFLYQGPITVDEILELKNNKVSDDLIQTLIEAQPENRSDPTYLTKKDLVRLSEANVSEKVVRLMLLGKVEADATNSEEEASSKTVLYSEKKKSVENDLLGNIKRNQ